MPRRGSVHEDSDCRVPQAASSSTVARNAASWTAPRGRASAGAVGAVSAGSRAAGVPVAPLPEEKSAEADRNRQWREVGVGAQILRDLGVTSIRHLTSSVHDYKGLSGFGIEIVSNEQLEG